MKISDYDIDLRQAIEIIDKNNYSLVALQIPEGLKIHVFKIIDYLEKNTNARFIIYAEPCFGACDIVSSDIKELGVDFAIQIGHASIPNMKNHQIPTIFINAKMDFDYEKIILSAIPFLKSKKIGLITTAQHAHMLDRISKFLVKHNFNPLIGTGDERIELKGQILGCNFTAAKNIAEKVDMFLFIGSGNFHPLGLLLATKKRVVAVDPYQNEIKSDELYDMKEAILRQRYGAIARSKDAETFGIIISMKSGQQRKELAYQMKELLEKKKKKAFIFILNHVSKDKIESFIGIDCFISTACPRIAIDDYMQYKIPIITPVELYILLGEKKWDDYQFDEI